MKLQKRALVRLGWLVDEDAEGNDVDAWPDVAGYLRPPASGPLSGHGPTTGSCTAAPSHELAASFIQRSKLRFVPRDADND